MTTTKSKTLELDVVTLKKIKTLDHQQKVVDFITKDSVRGLLVFHSVGSGKTITSILAAKAILEKDNNKHVIISTPASLISNFEKELQKIDIKNKEKILVESYQKLSNRLKSYGNGICTNSVFIIDESHNLNGGGMIFRNFFDCAKKAHKVILLSGTLVKNFPGEIARQLSLLEGTLINGKTIDSINSLTDDKKRRKLFNIFLKCKISFHGKKELDADFPKLTYNKVDLEMTPEYYHEYYNIQEDIRLDLPDFLEDTKNMTVFLNGIRRAVNKTNVLSPKITWIARKIVKDYNLNKKILIYSNWIDAGITILKDILHKEKIPFSYIIGGMTKSQKDSNLKNYNTGKTRIMLISASGSEGLNLKETRTVIIMEPHWNKTRIIQVVGRASRYRSHSDLPLKDRTVDVYQLVLKKPEKRYDGDNLDSADDRLYDLSEFKQSFINVFYDTLQKISIENDPMCKNYS